MVSAYIYAEFQGKSYDPKEAQNWSNEAAEEVIKRVQEQVPNDMKHTATIIILQKGDSGFHLSASCLWESKVDGNFNRKYEFEDFFVVVNFFGITRD